MIIAAQSGFSLNHLRPFYACLTHRGDKVPLGLYKDTAMTQPATTAGDPVMRWRDEVTGSGLFCELVNSTLQFENGKPCISALASESAYVLLPTPNLGTAGAELFFAFRNVDYPLGWPSFNFCGASNDPGTFLPFDGDGKYYDSFCTTARKDAFVDAAEPGAFAWKVWNPLSQDGYWRVYRDDALLYETTSNTFSAPSATGYPLPYSRSVLGGGTGPSNGFRSLRITAFILAPPAGANRQRVRQFCTNLMP